MDDKSNWKQTPVRSEIVHDNSYMILINITIDDRIDLDNNEIIESLSRQAQSTEDDTIAPSELQEILAKFPNEALNIRLSRRYPGWERGDTCPECGHDLMSVMCVEEDIYSSSDGKFAYEWKGEALGPQLSIRCRGCATNLAHIPYQHLTV